MFSDCPFQEFDKPHIGKERCRPFQFNDEIHIAIWPSLAPRAGANKQEFHNAEGIQLRFPCFQQACDLGRIHNQIIDVLPSVQSLIALRCHN